MTRDQFIAAYADGCRDFRGTEMPGANLSGAILAYAASRPDKPVPDFYASNDDAMVFIRKDTGQ